VSKPARAKVTVALGHHQRADAAAATVLRALLDAIRENLDGAVAGEDPEFLHQLRIAVRRSRTVQRQLAPVFGTHELPGFRTEFKWLQRVTGEARDLDVYLEDFESMRELVPVAVGPDLDPLRQVLGHWRMAAHGSAARALRSRRTAELLSDWDSLMESLMERPLEDRPAAALPIGELAGRRIRKVYKRLTAMGRAIDESSSAETYHELRKKGKELRYMLELFGAPLFDPEVVDGLVRPLKALQDVLGRHQDREVQMLLLRSLADEVAALPRGPRAVLAMGILVDRLELDERAAREEFAERFAAFSAKRQRRLVKATFA
jgi:CHAD domain-containing protein